MSVSFDLTGTTAVVTGAKRGIGFAMAEGLAASGADIIGVSATIEPTGSAIAAAVEAHGRSFEARAVDFADRAAVIGRPPRRRHPPAPSSLPPTRAQRKPRRSVPGRRCG